jgi:hypothetical protein
MFYTWFGGHQMTVIEADGVSRSTSIKLRPLNTWLIFSCFRSDRSPTLRS